MHHNTNLMSDRGESWRKDHKEIYARISKSPEHRRRTPPPTHDVVTVLRACYNVGAGSQNNPGHNMKHAYVIN